jgi:autotransporter-associated beta strand protein
MKASPAIKCIRRYLAALTCSVVFSLPATCLAQSIWTGGSANWSSDLNPGWNGSGVPNNIGASASYAGNVNVTTTQDVAAGVTVGTLTRGGTSNSNWYFTLTNPITFNQDGAGAGTAVISNTSSGVSNALILSDGTITLADDLLISNTGNSNTASGAVQIKGTLGGTGNITLANKSSLIGKSGSIRFEGGINTFTGTVLVQKGTTTFNLNSAFGGIATNTITLGQSAQGDASLISTAAVGSLVNNIVVAADSGGTLTLGSISEATSAATAYAGTVLLNGNLSLTSANSGTVTLSNTVSGAGDLLKTGDGIATLSGTNTYAGATTVEKGKLVINGANNGTGPVNVNAAATLGGTGSINSTTTLAATGRLAFTLGTVAASHEELVISSALVFLGTSVLDITARGTAPTSGVYTLVTTTGGITGVVPATVNLPPTWTAIVSISADNMSLLLDVISTDSTSPYGDWALAKGLDGTVGNENGSNDDPDNDGRGNLGEFAFDGNPLLGANDGKVVSKVATLLSNGNKVLTLTVPVRRGASFSGAGAQVSALIDGLVYTIQGNATLDAASWTQVVTEIPEADAVSIQAGLPVLSDINNDSLTDWTYRSFHSPGMVTDGDPRAFLRAKVTQP